MSFLYAGIFKAILNSNKKNDNKMKNKKVCWSQKFGQFKITIIIYHRIIKLNEPLSH